MKRAVQNRKREEKEIHMFRKSATQTVTAPFEHARFWGLFILSAAILLAPVMGHAFDASNIRVNGFASQGYIESTDNNFLVNDSAEGSYQINEAGLTVNARIDDNLRFGMQLLSRDFGTEGNNETKLDWGYGDYQVNDSFGVRFGKIKLPFGLYNQERDSDIVRSMAFLPQGVYSEANRDFMTGGVGFGAYGNIPLGAGDIDYQIFAGESNVSDEIALVKNQKAFMNNEIDNFLAGPGAAMVSGMAGTTIALAPLSGDQMIHDLEWNSDPIIAARVFYNTPLSGLRLGASMHEVSGTFDAYDVGGDNVGSVEAGFYDIYTYSVEYASSSFTVASEYQTYHYETYITQTDNSFTETIDTLTGGTVYQPIETKADDRDQETWYLMVSYQIPGADQFTVTGLYDEFYQDVDRKDESGQYRKDSAFGVKWDVTPSFAVKAEYHDVEGTAGLDIYNSSSEENWDYTVFKTSFVF
jgi:hypothetical protein